MIEYTQEEQENIINKVLMYFDGWKAVKSLEEVKEPAEEPETETDPEIEQLFNKNDEKIEKVFDHVNKRILISEVLSFYESSLNQALNITRQVKENLENLTDPDLFFQAVYKLTASNLWKKYNVRVNSNEEEADWKYSYSGVLYIQAMKELEQFKIGFNAAACYIPDE